MNTSIASPGYRLDTTERATPVVPRDIRTLAGSVAESW